MHAPESLPILLAGGAGGQHKGGSHLVCWEQPPVANLHVTILDKLGLKVDHFGESWGEIETLSV